MTDFARLRELMVSRQIEARGIGDPALLAALRAVPREAFVSPDQAYAAYEDWPLPIEAGQTISQPYIVALMIDAADISADDHVLEIGAGSGYAAAVIGRIAKNVVAIERHQELAALATARMQQLGYDNVRIVEGDGSRGWPEEAPFDAILAAASGSHVPQALIDQLKSGGRLVMPLGGRWSIQSLVKLTKGDNGTIDREELGAVRFVPLIEAD
jgi:protein-L-isoaspartate(D-aspartate) O-methyltransferase